MYVALRRFVTVATAALVFTGCSTTPLTAVSDFDTAYDFSRVSKLAILPIDRTSAAEKLISDMQVQRIDDALAQELEQRGYSIVSDQAQADLFLSWHLVTREKTDIRSYNAVSAYNCWRCGPPVSDVTVRHYTEGTFIVDLIDPLRNRSVWRSTIESRLEARPERDKADKNRAIAAKAVLAPFPPQPGES